MPRTGFALLALMLLSAPAMALESAPVRSARATATLVSDADTVQPGTKLHLGLRLQMAPGWHTYWQNPGDAGAAPELTLALPPGAAATPIEWPTPERLPEGPVMTYAYRTEVVLPVTVTPGSGALTVEATASWLVCEKVCVPEEGKFQLSLPAGAGTGPSAEAPLFAASLARVPRPSPFSATVAADGALTLSGPELSPATVQDAWFFPANWGPVDQAAPQPLTVAPGSVRLALTPGSGFKAADPLAGTVVLRDAGGQETFLSVSAVPGDGPASATTPFWQVVLLAGLGGLILNLMPCVFPVLAMKAVAVARMSGQGRGAIRAEAASYTAGVMLAFVGLGGLLIGLREAGGAAGWGFQFQSPVFVAVMAWVLLAVGLNLSGVFRVGARLAGAGQGLASRPGHAGSFFTGLLAVLVATPCTAPFMGAAIAAALAAPAVLSLLVFAAMGLGLAAPYAILALVPGLARLLPRPGAWMDVLKGVLAFPMYGAAAWLVWVISLQAGSAGLLATMAGMVLLGFAAWALGLAQTSGWRIGYGAAGLALMAVFGLLPSVAAAPPASAVTTTDGIEPFSAARLAALRAEGRPVFVNMTAAWCVSCLVNERVALSASAVRQAFTDHRVTYLKGDWTRGDPAITAFLREHARDGVPLYVLYPAGSGAPDVLPQILTESEMLSQLQRAGG